MPVKSTTKPANQTSLGSELNLLLRTPQRARLRKLIFTVHKWVGAVVALYILLMSLTGVSLVFHDELSDWLCPSPTVEAGSQRVPFSRIIADSEREYSGYKVTGLIVSHEKTRPMDVFASIEKGKKLHLEVNPYTSKVLGVKKENEVLKFLQDLHFNLLNGKTGRSVNGIGATCLFTLALTGVVVWWRGIANWLAAFRMPLSGSLKRINWNIHSALGSWVLPMLLVWSLSGFSFAFPELFEQTLNLFFPISSQMKLNEPVKEVSKSKLSSMPVSVDHFVETALANSGNKTFVDRIAFPDKRRKSVRIWLSEPTSIDPNAPRTQVFLHPKSGEVLAISTSEAPPTGDLIIQWLQRLHFGTWLGKVSKSAWLVVGLTPATLAITGLFLFANRIANRKEKKEESRIAEETKN